MTAERHTLIQAAHGWLRRKSSQPGLLPSSPPLGPLVIAPLGDDRPQRITFELKLPDPRLQGEHPADSR
jgi:hypothetical protein